MNPISVMIVDDQKLFRDGLRTVLSAQPGIAVVAEACNGEEAVSLGQEFLPKVVLMDLRMPAMNGVEATRRIREAEVVSGGHVPIVALTAHRSEESRAECLAAGVDAVLVKPISKHELDDVIARLAAASPP